MIKMILNAFEGYDEDGYGISVGSASIVAENMDTDGEEYLLEYSGNLDDALPMAIKIGGTCGGPDGWKRALLFVFIDGRQILSCGGMFNERPLALDIELGNTEVGELSLSIHLLLEEG